ncbi:MAG: glycosyltransferase family 39 protein, partial [Deltaproteobacteria bacterium]|nr:glycosyltransferase family 39 protein [Deltaproteobacteria bacterium]
AFLWAIHPYAVRLSVQALSDVLTAVFVALALWVGFTALRKGRLAWALGAGALSGLAYLARPEGIEPALVLPVIYWFHRSEGTSQSRQRTEPTLRRIGWVTAPLVGWAIVASPYIAHMSIESGSFTLSKKKSSIAMLRSLTPDVLRGDSTALESSSATSLEQGSLKRAGSDTRQVRDGGRRSESPAPGRIGRSIYVFQQPLVNGLHPFVLLFALIAAWHVPWAKVLWRDPACTLLLGLLALHLIVLIGLAALSGSTYLGGHHFFLMVLYALPFSGAGLAVTFRWIQQRMPTIPWLPAVVVIVMTASTILKIGLRDPGRESLIRPAAAWIREHTHERPIVVTNIAKLTYHAKAERVPLHGNYDAMIRSARARGAEFIAVYPEKEDVSFANLQGWLDSGELELAAEFSRQSRTRAHRFLIYRLSPPAFDEPK